MKIVHAEVFQNDCLTRTKDVNEIQYEGIFLLLKLDSTYIYNCTVQYI